MGISQFKDNEFKTLEELFTEDGKEQECIVNGENNTGDDLADLVLEEEDLPL